jgi:hypothetical protein
MIAAKAKLFRDKLNSVFAAVDKRLIADAR